MGSYLISGSGSGQNDADPDLQQQIHFSSRQGSQRVGNFGEKKIIPMFRLQDGVVQN